MSTYKCDLAEILGRSVALSNALLCDCEVCIKKFDVMSLYKARDWWTATCGSDEEFEAGSVVIGTIEDNASKPDTARSFYHNTQQISHCISKHQQGYKPKVMPCRAGTIITGSLRGMLRMYQPRQQGFSIEDLLIESQLQAPILQLELGTFTA